MLLHSSYQQGVDPLSSQYGKQTIYVYSSLNDCVQADKELTCMFINLELGWICFSCRMRISCRICRIVRLFLAGYPYIRANPNYNMFIIRGVGTGLTEDTRLTEIRQSDLF